MAGLVAVVPAVLHEGRAHAAPGQVNVGGLALFTQQVLEGIDRAGCPIIIGAEYEDAGPGEQRAERAQGIGHGLLIGKVIAGIDHEVWIQRIEGGDPIDLGLLARDHVQVRNMQQAELFFAAQGAFGQERKGKFLELEFVELAKAPSSNT